MIVLTVATYLFIRIGICGGKEPEEKTGISMRSVGQKTGIALADVERNVGEVFPVDEEFWLGPVSFAVRHCIPSHPQVAR